LKHLLIFFILLLNLNACTSNYSSEEKVDLEQLKAEIRQTEQAFNDMAAREGVPAAFLAFAAEDAVLNRNDQMIRGKKAIRTYFEAQSLKDVSLTWTPDFVEVAAAGDMAYTYGKYQFSAKDNKGQDIQAKGIFHTVWKKQADGSWKYVYD